MRDVTSAQSSTHSGTIELRLTTTARSALAHLLMAASSM